MACEFVVTRWSGIVKNPAWLSEGHFTSVELSRIRHDHIDAVVGHYRGDVFTWDVANEAFDGIRLGELRSTLWFVRPGIGSHCRHTRGAALPFDQEYRPKPTYRAILDALSAR